MGEAAPIRSEDAGVRGEAVVVAIFDRKLKFRNEHKEDSSYKLNPTRAQMFSTFGASCLTCDISWPIRGSVLFQILS